tara:strand:+ start:318 stop:491 length:174 start_codon:yes stop_codon:yes gene_type:complete
MITSKTSSKLHIADLHFKHTQWNRELKFLKDELKFFVARLEEVAVKYTSMEVLKELE